MRVLILGIDALEYSLVEEWNLKYLKQKEYGKTIVPLTKTKTGSHPATVVVWSCFITGKQPKEMGYETIKIAKRDRLDDLYWAVRSRFPKSEKIFKYFHRKSRSVNPTRKDIIAPTLFDNTNIKSIHLHVPVYDSDAFPEYRGVGIQHVFFRNKIKMMDYYMMFNMFVEDLTKKINDDVAVLIISDHGQKKGIHTEYGFYSCNKKLGLKNPNISDFKELIEKKVC